MHRKQTSVGNMPLLQTGTQVRKLHKNLETYDDITRAIQLDKDREEWSRRWLLPTG